MSNFKPLNVKKYVKTGAAVTADTVYWKRLGVPTLVKEFGAIDYIDFSSVEPFCFAVTCSVRVQIYNPITKLVVRNLSKFQENAYGGSFRSDGRLLVAGDEQGYVKLFDTSSKNVLRLFKGHKAPVHRTFFTQNLLHVVSFSDDKTIKLWDIATEKAILTFEEHTDYIRAGCVNPVSPNIVVSGGYDNRIKMYDTRTKEILFSIDHESPVESLLFLPTGGIFISAGGTEVRVWDAFAGCRLLTKLSQHHKTVTCLRLGSNGRRILSGGLDRHVKIYDVASYQTVHTLDFPNSILSLGVSPNDQTIAVGMVDGLVSIQNMESERNKDQQEEEIQRPKLPSIEVDHEIVRENRKLFSKYDTHLRKYEYIKCLDEVLVPYIVNKKPEVTVSVMQELIRRKGLHRAFTGRPNSALVRIITFICRYIGEHRFTRVLIDAAMILLDVYEETLHELNCDMEKQFIKLAEIIQKETALTHDLLEFQGSMDLLLAATHITENPEDNLIEFVKNNHENDDIKQSSMAKESSIMEVA